MFKRKMIAPLVAILLCVGMVSVGFAAWVITNTDTKNTSGSFDVYEVKNKDITITPTMSENTVKFAGDGEEHIGAWLSFNSGDVQDLDCTLQVTINNWATLQADKTNVITLQVNGAEAMNSANAVTITNDNFTNNNYIVLPSAGSITISYDAEQSKWVAAKTGTTGWGAVSVNTTADTATVTLVLEFGWGTAFGEMNPLDYYNGNGHSYESDHTNAETALANLYALNEGTGSDYAIYVKGSVA